MRKKKEEGFTESIIDEVVEGVAVTVVGELVVGGRELLKALEGYAGEVAAKVSVLRKDHRPTRHEAVDQRLLPHPEIHRERMERVVTCEGCCFSERERERGFEWERFGLVLF